MGSLASSRREALRLLAGGGAAAFSTAALAQRRAPYPGFKVEPDRELYVPVRGGRIYVRVNGSLDGPRAPLLMIHGGPGGDHVSFVTALPLARQRGVILYDQLDSGLSDHPHDPANWTVERFVSEIDAIRETLALKDLHILGHSWGGTLAAEYASRQPPALKSVVLQGAFLSTTVWRQDAERNIKALPARFGQTLARCDAAGYPDRDPDCTDATWTYYRSFNGRASAPAYVQSYFRTVAARVRQPRGQGPDVYGYMWGKNELNVTGTLKTYEGGGLLPKIAAPALFLNGEFDEVTTEAARRFAAKTPRAEIVTTPGASHTIQFDAPDEYVRVLQTWLARHD